MPPSPDDEGPPGARPEPGLYIVSTPIGAARDITLRALDLLRGVEVLAAEDTRSLRRLMEIHGVPLAGRPLIACHDHNEAEVTPRLLALLAAGKSVAYCSEAGTPLVSDPGFRLTRAAREAGHRVTAAPGASALLAALAVAGLPTDRFLFAGFPPAAAGARAKFLAGIAAQEATVVLYESPRRIKGLLRDLAQICGEEREAALCRELTKRFEEVRRGPLGRLAADLPAEPRGEFVLVLDRAPAQAADPASVEAALRAELQAGSARDAATAVAARFALPRREVYAMAVRIAAEGR